MTKFEGFKDGCPALAGIGPHPYIHTDAFFEKDGKTLMRWDAGIVEPDAIRLSSVDDYHAPTGHERVLAFTPSTAEVRSSTGARRIAPEGVRLLLDEQIERLNNACDSCLLHRGRECPVLAAAYEEFDQASELKD